MNVLVICCDTFRHDMIDHPVVRTPNLDRLAAEGIVFTNAWAEGLPTIQARRTMFTGIRSFPWRFVMGCRGLTPAIPGWHRMPDEQTCLAEHLLEAGVVTGLVADTYHMFKPTQNFTRGFASWNFIRGQEGDPVRSGPLDAIDVSPYMPDASNDPNRWPTLTQYLLNMLDRRTEEDYLPARVFRAASTWLEENARQAPWMLWVDSFAPHERWDPPMEFADAYFPPGRSRNYIQPQLINNTNPTPDEIERTKALYYGYVTFVDKWIGVLLDKLAQLGGMDDTAVIFTSDHGTELWDKGRFAKGGDRLYAYNTKLPLIVRLPGSSGDTIQAGRRQGDDRNALAPGDPSGPRPSVSCPPATRDDLAGHLDVFRTVCGLMGVAVPDDLAPDGRDLFDVSAEPREKAIIAWGENVSVRDGRWNMVIDSTTTGAAGELYDLAADPDERENVFEQHPEVVAEFKGYLEGKLGKLPYEIRHTGDKRQAPPLWWTFRKK